MELNFRCKSCGTVYDYEVGKLTFDENGDGQLEHYPICPDCNQKDQWALTEYGQGQVTEIHLSELDF